MRLFQIRYEIFTQHSKELVLFHMTFYMLIKIILLIYLFNDSFRSRALILPFTQNLWRDTCHQIPQVSSIVYGKL